MARPKEFDTNRVLDKAMQLFWCRGYEATSMQDLVEAMGINRQSIYDTFGDKHALFLAALKLYQEVQVTNLVNTLKGEGSGKAAIKQAFEEVVKSIAQSEQRVGCLMVNSTAELVPRDEAVAGWVSRDLARTQAAFYDALLRAEVKGELGSQQRDLKALANFLNSSLKGLQITAKANADLTVLQNIVRVTLSVLD